MRPFLLLPAWAFFLLSCCCTSEVIRSRAPNSNGATLSERGAIESVVEREGRFAPKSCSELRAVVNVEYEPILLSMLEGAKERIRIVHFECNNDYVVDKVVLALANAVERGVNVKVLLEGDVDDNRKRVEELNAAGVQAKLDGKERYTHAKLVVVDGTKALFGSTNFSYKSMLYNNETNLFINCPTAAEWYEKLVDFLWEDPTRTVKLPPISVDSIGLVTTLCDDSYFEIAHPLVEGGRERVLLMVYGFHMDPRYPNSDVHKMAQALVNARKRGLDVRVLLERSDYNRILNKMNEVAAGYLAGEGVKVRFDPPKKISHAKLLIVDGTAIVGSNNWAHGGFHIYHEVGGVTNNAEVVGKLAAYFEELWDQGEEKR